jgi:hypothetical protein
MRIFKVCVAVLIGVLVALLSESSCEGYGAESQPYGGHVFE